VFVGSFVPLVFCHLFEIDLWVLIVSSARPWLDNFSRSTITTWVELLVLESLVGKMLWNPCNILVLVTSPGSLGWKNTLEAHQELWVGLLVLEALVGQTLWKPSNSCGLTN